MSGDGEQSGHEGLGDRLELALRASNEGVWDWWVGRPEIYYSRRILEFLECGMANAPNLFLVPHTALHDNDREEFAAALAGVLAPGGPELLAIDCRVRTGAGSWRWLRIRGTVVRDRTGAARRIAGSMIDISRRKNAEGQLEEERHLLRLVIENVPLQVYFKDFESRFVLANRRMAAWMGLADARQLLGKHDRDFFASEHWQQAADDERRIIDTGEPMLGMLEKETWPGRPDTWVLTSKFPWRDRYGTVRGTFGVSSDVTELVEAQQQSALLAAELKVRNEAYEEELLLAREIQQALSVGALPLRTLAAPDGMRLEFAAHYVPTSGLAGDFYEVVPIGPRQVGLLICDVMGHGVRAALVVAMMRGLVEKERGRAAVPEEFLAGLNSGLHAILGRAEVTIFVTAFYAVVDLDLGVLRCANAGHPAAIGCGPAGIWRLGLDRAQKGPALGLLPAAGFPAVALPLGQVRRLVLFTDGLVEAENAGGEAFGEDRLVEALRARCGIPLQQALDQVVAEVLGCAQTDHFDDDVCMLGVDLPAPR